MDFEFIVMEVYKEGNEGTSSILDEELWKCIWGLKIPPNVKHTILFFQL